jgi:hypothetical protein
LTTCLKPAGNGAYIITGNRSPPTRLVYIRPPSGLVSVSVSRCAESTGRSVIFDSIKTFDRCRRSSLMTCLLSLTTAVSMSCCYVRHGMMSTLDSSSAS